MAEKTRYTVGFLHNDSEMVLVRKNRPEWQYGLFNGVGGHIELNETPHECQVREFQEETGVYIPNWEHFLTLSGTSSEIYVYATYDSGNWIRQVETKTDEEICVVRFAQAWQLVSVPNLKWIVPLMRQRGNYEPVAVNFYGE